MRKAIFFLLFLNTISSIYGQDFELSGIFASSSSKKFKNNYGFTVGYSHDIKSKDKLGISFSQYFYNSSYDDIYHPFDDPTSLSITETDPHNKRYAVEIYYVFGLINHPKSKLYFGPKIGLNYFLIDENFKRSANGSIVGGSFISNYKLNSRIGIGCLLEFQLDEVVSKNISTVLSINPEITNFERNGTYGSSNPYLIGWLNFKLGIRYNLKAEKKE